MARPVEWFQRLPRILAILAQSDAPALLNRTSIQQLFGVERRNAQYLLRRFGAVRLGNALVIERERLASQLEGLAGADDFERRRRRHEQVRTVLTEARATWQLARISLPEPSAEGLSQLPPTIQLEPGRLAIHFSGAVDLLGQLLELSKAIGEDFDRFEGMLNQDPLPS